MASQRQRQVAELIHQEISQLIQYSTQDPRLGFVTVTGVDVTGDLRLARVYISVLGDEKEAKSTLRVLANAANFFRHEMRQTLSLRYIPELTFKLDDSLERGNRIETLLDKIKEEEAGASQSSAEADPSG
jgi:ribosome-binding factor A